MEKQPTAGNTPPGEDNDLGQLAALEGDIERIRQELADATDRALRAHAELENYRKRAQRERDDERRYANSTVLRDLLPVLDNMGRAVEAAEKNPDPTRLLEGFNLVAKQLEDLLARYSCVRIDALNQPFDPNLHQAILQQASAEHPSGTVIGVAQEGYQLFDRVIRPSQVIVSTGKPS